MPVPGSRAAVICSSRLIGEMVILHGIGFVRHYIVQTMQVPSRSSGAAGSRDPRQLLHSGFRSERQASFRELKRSQRV